MYKSVSADLILGVTLRWTSITSRASRNTLSRLLHAIETGDKRRPDEPLGSNADPAFYRVVVDRKCGKRAKGGQKSQALSCLCLR